MLHFIAVYETNESGDVEKNQSSLRRKFTTRSPMKLQKKKKYPVDDDALSEELNQIFQNNGVNSDLESDDSNDLGKNT